METIFALSSARGKAGVAVIRVSGPEAKSAVIRLGGTVPPPRKASLMRLNSSDGSLLDEAVVLFFSPGASYTGEETIEFHTHGGMATVNAVLRELGAIHGFRIAEPGEFTLQALLNGRLGLAEIEGLGDLIQAETEAQRRQALKVFEGALSVKAENWRNSLIRCASLLEVSLDFADEDLPGNLLEQLAAEVMAIAGELNREARGVESAERIREGFEVAIVGLPNTGKSTLLNHLAGREAAITSEFAGTTRDVIEVRMEVGGLPVTFLDLAGFRAPADPIEKIGVERSEIRAKDADLRIFLVEDSVPASLDHLRKPDDLILIAKADKLANHRCLAVSGKTGQGVDEMTALIAGILERRAAFAMTAINARHRIAIESASACLGNALNALQPPESVEVAAEEIRQAMAALESLLGRIDIEHILDDVFAGFCLGK